jgi:PIN domain nuclease of toxin-antitoxin system
MVDPIMASILRIKAAGERLDPFDRLPVAQALTDSIPIVSGDGQLDACGITRIW